jgi:hypothetical protein
MIFSLNLLKLALTHGVSCYTPNICSAPFKPFCRIWKLLQEEMMKNWLEAAAYIKEDFVFVSIRSFGMCPLQVTPMHVAKTNKDIVYTTQTRSTIQNKKPISPSYSLTTSLSFLSFDMNFVKTTNVTKLTCSA